MPESQKFHELTCPHHYFQKPRLADLVVGWQGLEPLVGQVLPAQTPFLIYGLHFPIYLSCLLFTDEPNLLACSHVRVEIYEYPAL